MPIGEEPQETEAINASIRAAGREPYGDVIHPKSDEFSADQLRLDPILRYFHYKHLPMSLQAVSGRFCTLAGFIVGTIPRNAERTVALRKLLEAKDAAVRANIPNPIQASTNTFVDTDADVRVTGGGSSETPIPFDD